MSSMRNAVQRRNHKERAQPKEREKWGLLEKAKDYKLRAADFKVKKRKLKALREKAQERNPDEFRFGMMSSATKNGIKVADRGNEALSMDVVKLLKTQDAGYLRTVLQITRRQRERLEGGSGALSLEELGDVEEVEREHTVFADSREQQRRFDPEGFFGTDEDGLEKVYNRPRRPSQATPQDDEEDDNIEEASTRKVPKNKKLLEAEQRKAREVRALQKKLKHGHEVRQRHIQALKARERALTAAEQELELQRAKMSNSIGGVNRNGVKFKIRERKR